MLSQVQIIRSLGEALSWFEKELAWGVQPAQLGHLTGRIGELYAAMITRGQMALATNQHGYDVISSNNERVSVKTVTSSTHVTFKRSTCEFVDRVIVLRLNVEEGEASIEEVLDCPVNALLDEAANDTADLVYRLRSARPEPISLDHIAISATQCFDDYRISQYENGTIRVERHDELIAPALPTLRAIASTLGVPLINSAGGTHNTRQLGAAILAVLQNSRGAAKQM